MRKSLEMPKPIFERGNIMLFDQPDFSDTKKQSPSTDFQRSNLKSVNFSTRNDPPISISPAKKLFWN